MNQEEDYASDSDQSDEDFCPDKETGVNDSDAGSGEDTDDTVDGDDGESSASDDEKNKNLKRRQKKNKKSSKSSNSRTKADKKSNDCAAEGLNTNTKRSTRQAESTNGTGKVSTEKNELESDDDEKCRTDALWADFLSDVKPASSSKEKITSIPTKAANGVDSLQTTSKKDESLKSHVSEKLNRGVDHESTTTSARQIEVTEILDFAGEEVRIQKIVNAESIKENKTAPSLSKTQAQLVTSVNSRSPVTGLGSGIGTKRPMPSGGGAGGLGSILNQIGKKKKISVLEKTKLDWNSFKQDEGIDEELQTYNKGKDGYLERQDFLQRTDLRQFEIEKVMRQSKRTN